MDEHQKRSDNEEYLEEHSLPGTNMAGKGPADKRNEEDRRHNPDTDSPAGRDDQPADKDADKKHG